MEDRSYIKGQRKTTLEPIQSLKIDQPDIVKDCMKATTRKSLGKIGATTVKKDATPKRKVKRMASSLL